MPDGYLTVAELAHTALLVEEDVGAGANDLVDAVESPVCRALNPARMYRLLLKRVVYPHKLPEVRYVDVQLPEHHTLRGARDAAHVCGSACATTVRLIPIGREDLLQRYLRWWRLLCISSGLTLTTVLVEQAAYVVQEQLRAACLAPRYLFTDVQFTVSDMPIVLIKSEDADEAEWRL